MTKYFYTIGGNSFGPFSIDELKEQNLTRDTKVWYYGLDGWRNISDVQELENILKTIPPDIKINNQINLQNNKVKALAHVSATITENSNKRKFRTLWFIIAIISVFVCVILFIVIRDIKNNNLYKDISLSAYTDDTDFQMYVNKFYRDLEFYGIYPKKPKNTMVKFSKLDQLDNTTHLHGISYGINNDELIEIYINPSTWEKFNKPLRYFLMYHELAHDVLNLEDLNELPLNEGKLMYPAISSYENITMDDFIESTHLLFEELSSE